MANFDTVGQVFTSGTGLLQAVPLTLASATETAFQQGSQTAGTTSLLIIRVPGTPVNPAGGSNAALIGSASPVEYNASSAGHGQSFGRKAMVINGQEPGFFSATTFDGGRAFKIRLMGTATSATGSSNTVAINLYQGTSATLGSDHQVAGLTAGGGTGASVNWILEALIQWDITSQTLGGWYMGQIGNTLTSPTALTNAATVTTAAGLTFIPSAVFGNAAGGTVTIAEASVEQV